VSLRIALFAPALFCFMAFGIVCMRPRVAHAQGAPSGADEVYVGIYVNQVTELSLKENRFQADFWLWFRWQNDAIKPYQSFEIANGRISSKTEPSISKVKGANYAVTRVVATMTTFWDVSRYPLDDHDMPIVIEDGNSEEFKLLYVADVVGSNVDPDFRVPGWSVSKSAAHVNTTVKRSNYGDISLPSDNESRYSSFRFVVKLERRGAAYFVKHFSGLFIAVLIAFLAFFIRPTDVDPRFGLGVGALFAAVASEYVVTGALPDSGVLSLADKLHIVAFGFIFLSLVQSACSLQLFHDERMHQSNRIDRWARVLFPASYTFVTAAVVLLS
jgi:hypothetical protein